MPSVILFTLALLFLAASFRIGFYYYIAYFFIIAAILSRLWVDRAARALELRRILVDHAFLDEEVRIRLEAVNKSRLPIPWVRVHDRLPARLTPLDAFRAVISLRPRESRSLEYALDARWRGYYPLGPVTVTVGDVFGFRQRVLTTERSHYLTVYPKIVPLSELGLPSRSPLGHLRTHQVMYEDPARVNGVRDYIRGDSLRKINWKVSAALGKLQVKTHEPAITLETALFLNLNAQEYDLSYVEPATEFAIVVAASLASHLAELRQPVGLVTNARDPAAAPEDAEEEDELEEDARGRTDGGGTSAGAPGARQEGRESPDPRMRTAEPQVPPIVVPPGKGRAHLMRILEVLARAEAKGTIPIADLLKAQAARLPWGSTIIIITWGRAPGLLDTLLALRRANFIPVLVLVRFGQRDTYSTEVRAMAIPVHEVRKEEDIDVFRPRALATA